MVQGSFVACLCLLLLFGVLGSALDALEQEKAALAEVAVVNPNVFAQLPANHPLYKNNNANTKAKENAREFNGKYERGTAASGKGKRALVNVPYSSYPELTAGTKLTGTFLGQEANGNDTLYFVIYLAAGQVAQFVTESDPNYNQLIEGKFRLVGSENEPFGTYFDLYTGGTNNVTLADHCLERPAAYFFSVASYSIPVNYTITFTKYSPKLSMGNTVATVLAWNMHQYAIPVTSMCKRLVVDVEYDGGDLDFNYKCRYANNEQCFAAGDYSGQSYISTLYVSGHISTQIVVNCTSPGNYYLRNYIYNNELHYNISITEGYTCQDWCMGGGICDLASATCTCMSHLTGPNCTEVVPNTPTAGPPSITNVPVDGTLFNYSNTNIQVLSQWQYVKLEFTPFINGVIYVHANLRSRGDYPSGMVYFYFHRDSLPTPTNYTTYEYASYSGNTLRDVELRLCATSGGGVWYIGMAEVQHPDGALPDIGFTVSMDTLVSTNTFSSTFNSIILYTTTHYQVFKFTAPSDGYAYVRVNENPTLTSFGGITSVSSECRTFGKDAPSANSDASVGVVRYQSVVQVKASTYYYVVVSGNINSSFSGTVEYSDKQTSCGCAFGKGFCSIDNVCVCKYGWTGPTCTQFDNGTNPTVLTETPTDVAIPDKMWSEPTGTSVLVIPVIPAGFTAVITINVTSTAAMSLSYATAFVPNPFTSTFFGITKANFVDHVVLRDCAAKKTTQMFSMLKSSAQKTASAASVKVVLVDTRVQVGTPKTFNTFRNSYFPVTVVLPENCTGAYYITLTSQSFGGISEAYGGPGQDPNQGSCDTSTSFETNSTTSQMYAVIASPSICSLGITVYFYTSARTTVTVETTPTSACPGNCFSHGQCMFGGVCKCKYPYIGPDCAAYDNSGSNFRASFNTCRSDALAVYNANYDSADYQYCQAVYDDAYSVPFSLDSVKNKFAAGNVTLSTSCQKELAQIYCDWYFIKTQPQATGGTKFLAPCNCFNFTSKCAPNFGSTVDDLEDFCNDIKFSVTYGYSICNPNPGNEGGATTQSGGATGTNGGPTNGGPTNGGPTNGNGNGGTSSSPGQTTTGSNNNSDASGLNVAYALVLVLVAVCFAL